MHHPKLKYVLSALYLLWGFMGLAQEQIQGLHWKFKGPSSNTWSTAKVPGNVFTDLLNASKIPNPFNDANEDSVQWVSDIDWQYQSFPFDIEPDLLKKEHLIIQFPGIDGEAEVYLNEVFLFRADNYYRLWEWDVKKILKPSGNIIELKFTSPNKSTSSRAESYGFTPPGDERVFLRKPPFHWGWDWGPKLVGVGITEEPLLLTYDESYLEAVRFETKSLDAMTATMGAIITIRSDSKEKAEVQINSGTDVWSIQEISLKPGIHDYRINFEVKYPKPWWTNDLGEPHLYPVDIRVFVGNNPKAHKKQYQVGIRTIKLTTEEDAFGRQFQFVLNGTPLFAKGANYIPQSPFQGMVKSDNYKSLIDEARLSNMNMLRVWGGGVYEDQEFYDRCDQSGILVWQDFMFACAMYPGNREFLENVSSEAEYQIRRLSGHACLALWCGNNEIAEGWERWGWKNGLKTEQRAKLEQAYRQIFKTILPEMVASHSDLNYWESSPLLGRGDPEHQRRGDAHYWGVWHDAEPFAVLEEKVPRFMSEFGMQSMPSLSTWEKYLSSEELTLNSEVLAKHQKHPRGNELMGTYMERMYGLPNNLEDFIHLSQATQAHGIGLGIEAQRRNKPYCMGTLYWQYNDCWPASSWSSRDVEGRWKPLQYVVKRSYRNLLLSTVQKGDNLELFAVNDSSNVFDGLLNLELINFGGDVVWKKESNCKIGSFSSEVIAKLKPSEIDSEYPLEKLILKARFEDPIYGKSECHHFFADPKDLELVEVAPAVFVESVEGGYELTVISETLIRDFWIDWEGKGILSDNFFDVLPFEPRKLFVSDNSGNPDPEFRVKCWNTLEPKLRKRGMSKKGD